MQLLTVLNLKIASARIGAPPPLVKVPQFFFISLYFYRINKLLCLRYLESLRLFQTNNLLI